MFLTACNIEKEGASSKAELSVQKFPFSLSVVPETRRGERFGRPMPKGMEWLSLNSIAVAS